MDAKPVLLKEAATYVDQDTLKLEKSVSNKITAALLDNGQQPAAQPV